MEFLNCGIFTEHLRCEKLALSSHSSTYTIKVKSNITDEYNFRVDDLGQDRDSPTDANTPREENKEVTQKLLEGDVKVLIGIIGHFS